MNYKARLVQFAHYIIDNAVSSLGSCKARYFNYALIYSWRVQLSCISFSSEHSLAS